MKSLHFIKQKLCMMITLLAMLIAIITHINQALVILVPGILLIIIPIKIDSVVNQRIQSSILSAFLKISPPISISCCYAIGMPNSIEWAGFLYGLTFILCTLPFFIAATFVKKIKKLDTGFYSFLPVAIFYFYLLFRTSNAYIGLFGIFAYLLSYFMLQYSLSVFYKKASWIIGILTALLLFCLQLDIGGGSYISFAWNLFTGIFVILFAVINYIISTLLITMGIADIDDSD
ncbi:MAG: hypothetical protein K0R90_137 [Oscillospiraceae bacterium]|jgi:hypothetical protein|nr:hypothetical protein [Oscillospiraceae bacterium]